MGRLLESINPFRSPPTEDKGSSTDVNVVQNLFDTNNLIQSGKELIGETNVSLLGGEKMLKFAFSLLVFLT